MIVSDLRRLRTSQIDITLDQSDVTVPCPLAVSFVIVLSDDVVG